MGPAIRLQAACLVGLCYESGVHVLRAFSVFALSSLCSVFVACGGEDTVTDVGSVDSGRPDTTTDTGSDTGTADTGADTFVPSTDTGDAADADSGPTWPSCDSKPTGTTTATIPALWTANPSSPTYSWVSGVIVTAVTGGGCVAGKACDIYVQEQGTETTLAGAAHKAMKVFVSDKASSHFTGIAPGDKVDLAAHAWRYTVGGQNELLLQVNDAIRGCIKKTGTGSVAAVPATLMDLSVSAYETNGPVLITLSNVTADTDAASLSKTTNAMFPTTGGFEAGTFEKTSLSPFCLAGGAFTGMTTSKRYDFTSVTGVFSMYIPGATTDAGLLVKILELCPRTMTDVVIK